MNTRRLFAMTLLAILAHAPVAQGGDREHPEIADAADDVEVNDGANCGLPLPPGCAAGMDFFWHNADVELVWVNDTADAIILSMELRASEGFSQDNEGGGALGRSDAFTYTYSFAFSVGGKDYTASAIVDDALAVTVDGAASAASIDGRDLTVTVAKAGLDPVPQKGAIVSGLALAMHGESSVVGTTLDDRAPDANEGPDYVLTASPTGNMAGDGTDAADDGQAMPGTALPALVACLAAAVVSLRRRT